jgi:glycosyltransferase involved in cell wall biosynthesis
LLDIYGTGPEKVFVIPHGSADNRVAVAPQEASHPPMALTWGLLGPGKGIEHAIAAVALLRDRGRRVAYTIAGQTHPRVRARDGEAYRSLLGALASALGVAEVAPQLLWPAVALSYRDLAAAVACSCDGAVA